MTASPARQGPSLGQVLLKLRRTCPTPERPLGGDFLELWKKNIDLPYQASRWDLLQLLILNREVAAQARGPEGDAYARTATLNTVRLLARMGERKRLAEQPRAVQRMVEHDPDEDRWLRWLLARIEGQDGAEALQDWQPRTALGRTLREGCSLLEARDVDGLSQHAQALDDSGDSNTPLGALRRAIRLELARVRLADGDLKGARALVAAVGSENEPEARRIELHALGAAGGLAPDQVEACAGEARYGAYRSLRQARRHENLDYRSSAHRWWVEVDAWKTLRARFCGDVQW